MFGLEGYLTLRELAGQLDQWVERIICAKVLEGMDKDPSRAFVARVEPDLLTAHLELWRVVGMNIQEAEVWRHRRHLEAENLEKFEDAMNEHFFEYSILMNMMLAKIFADSTPLMVSPNGKLLTAPEVIGFHMDRLDLCGISWPLRENAEFHGYFTGFDQGRFGEADLDARFCFVDRYTGLVALKNNSIQGYKRASHTEFSDNQIERLERAVIRPFIDWSIVWNPKDLPDTPYEIFNWYGWLDSSWAVDPVLSQQDEVKAVGKRGRKPSGAKSEYFRRYPEAKPADISFEAISAELTEAGFRISARTLQNYEKDRPGR